MIVTCDKCGGEGKLFTSRYGGNDPDVWCTGTCDVCEGSGEVPLTDDMLHEMTDQELHLLLPKLDSDPLKDVIGEMLDEREFYARYGSNAGSAAAPRCA